ncbi:Hypothetical protein PHPALM_9564 [Phytophthora palmivora]|uniref:Uncharacterized protein n=1 Tax=Phytophthora palmivora TaxID=4796 RepID=A0A2P4Y6Y4_9STRA|nr:Hypothetical protein PHPALM_9564 [Phytophthora palmivora]
MLHEWKKSYDCSGITFRSLLQALHNFERLEQSERQRNKEDGANIIATKHHNKRGVNAKVYECYSRGNSGERKSQHKNKSESNKRYEVRKTRTRNDSECFTHKRRHKDEMVIGRALLSTLGIIVNFRDGTVEWNENTLTVSTGVKRKNMNEINDTSVKPTKLIGDASITDDTYKEVAKGRTCFETLYNGHLDRTKLPDYIFLISDSATPIHPPPYSIIRSEEEAARKELQCLIKLDAIEQIFDGEWAPPAFS